MTPPSPSGSGYLGGAYAAAPSPPSTQPGFSIPPELAPLTPQPDHHAPYRAPGTGTPYGGVDGYRDYDDTDSPSSLATGGDGVPSNMDPPIIIGPDDVVDNNDDDASGSDTSSARYRRNAPAPIYPLALEIPRINEPEPDPMDTYPPGTSPSHDLETGLRSRPPLAIYHPYGSVGFGRHSRAGSDVSSAVSTPHSPVRFKDPIADEAPTPPPSIHAPSPAFAHSPSGVSSRGGDGNGADPDAAQGGDEDLLFPGFVPTAFRCLTQTTQPRYYCLKTITWPWFERISMGVILLNCVTLGMYQPCNDEVCDSLRCQVLAGFDHFIFAFFAIEMFIKITAMGLWGKDTYLAETWNRLDMFIVIAG